MSSGIRTIFIFLLITALGACRKDVKKELRRTANFDVAMKVDDKSLGHSDTTSLDADYNIYVTLFQLYLTNITLLDAEGNETPLKDVVLLNVGSADNSSFSVNLPAGEFTHLRMGLGVDPVQNNADPVSFPNDHPLAAYQGTYWGWLKYRFAVFEGGAIDKHTGNTIILGYHPGTDPLYKAVTFPVNMNSSSAVAYDLDFSIDLVELFDGPGGKIDFPTQSTTHTVDTDPHDYQIAVTFMENLKAAIDLKTITPQE